MGNQSAECGDWEILTACKVVFGEYPVRKVEVFLFHGAQGVEEHGANGGVVRHARNQQAEYPRRGRGARENRRVK
jgi:hypothetical protein